MGFKSALVHGRTSDLVLVTGFGALLSKGRWPGARIAATCAMSTAPLFAAPLHTVQSNNHRADHLYFPSATRWHHDPSESLPALQSSLGQNALPATTRAPYREHLAAL